MDARLQRRVQRYGWDRAAPYYERCWWRQLEPAQRRLLESLDLLPGEQVVETACGTGLVTLPAARAIGPEGELVATDLSEAMVEALRGIAEREELPQVRAERMDAERLELPDGAFDVGLCALGLMYVPDPVRALAEMLRVLRPGGRAGALVWGARERCGWADIFPIVDARVRTEVCPMFFQLGTGSALAIAFEMAGFGAIETERMSTPLRYESAEDAVAAAFLGGPVALAYSRFDERTRDAAHREYLASIEPYRSEGGYAIPGEFVIVTGRKPSVE